METGKRPRGDRQMATFTATFSTGETITRSSARDYAFAWAVIRSADGVIEYSGFSAGRANAANAARAKMNSPVSERSRKNPGMRRYWTKMAKDKGFADVDALLAHWDAEGAARNAARRIEIVPV